MRLHDYQERALAFSRENPRCLLALDPGFGKSAVAAMGIEPLVGPTVVVAPPRVAVNTWPAELRKWRPDLTVQLVQGSPRQRAAQWRADADVFVVGYSLVGEAIESGVPWARVILDESHCLRNTGSKQFKAVRKLTAPPHLSVVELTGTPTPNGLDDLFGQVLVLDQGARLGRSLTAFRDRFMTAGRRLPTGAVVGREVRASSVPVIHSLVADLIFRESAPPVAGTPGVVPVWVSCPMTGDAVGAYRGMARDLVAEVESGSVLAESAAVATSKLQQIAAGFVYDEDRVAHPLHSVKLDALREIVGEAAGPVLVWYRFAWERDAVLGMFEGARDVREPGAVDAWNAGSVPVLVAHPESAGSGLNLQGAGSGDMVWLTLPWSTGAYTQAVGRLARQGASVGVVRVHVLGAAPVDSAVWQRLGEKLSVQEALLQAVELSG